MAQRHSLVSQAGQRTETEAEREREGGGMIYGHVYRERVTQRDIYRDKEREGDRETVKVLPTSRGSLSN